MIHMAYKIKATEVTVFSSPFPLLSDPHYLPSLMPTTEKQALLSSYTDLLSPKSTSSHY